MPDAGAAEASESPSSRPHRGILRALSHGLFATLWVGQTLSRVGDHAYEVTLSWWILETTRSPGVLGTVLVLAFLPNLAFLLVGGVAVERYSRTWVMFWSPR